ncbi:Hypothetical predicted protein, partial [Marmota monax]
VALSASPTGTCLVLFGQRMKKGEKYPKFSPFTLPASGEIPSWRHAQTRPPKPADPAQQRWLLWTQTKLETSLGALLE